MIKKYTLKSLKLHESYGSNAEQGRDLHRLALIESQKGDLENSLYYLQECYQTFEECFGDEHAATQ